jgi:hypothetical protein
VAAAARSRNRAIDAAGRLFGSMWASPTFLEPKDAVLSELPGHVDAGSLVSRG